MDYAAPEHSRGFTLIELSIVLVIIGLIVGGVLVGQDLIKAAEVRATISQIEKYNTAVNTFYGKYGGLPGDLNAVAANTFGFMARGTVEGEGDGNGVIEGPSDACAVVSYGIGEAQGEAVAFWEDLSAASLIDGSFNGLGWNGGDVEVDDLAMLTTTTNPSISTYFPPAKLGRGNYIYVYSGGTSGSDGINYYGLSTVVGDGCFVIQSNPGLTVSQAYSIDKKIDDGFPQRGRVTATYLNADASLGGSFPVMGNTSNSGAAWVGASDTSATQGTAATCYDNGNAAGAIQQYSMAQNGGAGVNCALSFQFQ